MVILSVSYFTASLSAILLYDAPCLVYVLYDAPCLCINEHVLENISVSMEMIPTVDTAH